MHPALRILKKASPIATCALLVVMIALRSAGTTRIPGADIYFQDVKEVVKAIPYKIGDSWVGHDIETPPAAVQLLKPNVLLHRRYNDLKTGRTFSLLIVHCGDVRDMIGHYPPNCYPAHGWREVANESAEFSLSGLRFPAREYLFSRVSDGVEARMRVFNFFVLPDTSAQIYADYEALDRASRGRRSAALGAAQVQVLGGENLTVAERREVVQTFVQAIESTVRTVGEGVKE